MLIPSNNHNIKFQTFLILKRLHCNQVKSKKKLIEVRSGERIKEKRLKGNVICYAKEARQRTITLYCNVFRFVIM